MNRYTIIVTYNGGTYIQQVMAAEINDVALKWMEAFEEESPLLAENGKFIDSFEENNKEYGLIKIGDRFDVWAFDFKFRRKIAYGHVIYSGILE